MKTLAQPALLRMRKIFNYTAGCKVFSSRRRLYVRMPRDLSRAKRRWAL